MTSAYILIAAMLVLGGIIAALGDRLGTKVGKARLRLFNLRPRQTAIVVTVATGTLIAASTLGILFAFSESLRQGVFELDTILKKRREVKAELDKVTAEKQDIEEKLSEAKTEQGQVQKRLQQSNLNFQKTQNQLKAISNQAQTLGSEIKNLLRERQQLSQQREQLKSQISQVQQELNEREQKIAAQDQILREKDQVLQEKENRLQQLERQQSALQLEISRRDEVIGKLDLAIATKDEDLKARETKLKSLESQLEFLRQEVVTLEQYYQNYQELREKSIALVRGQVLAFGTVRITDTQTIIPVIDQLLAQANRTAIVATNPGNSDINERLVKITKAQVQQLIDQLKDGQEYVVRILSAGNYVLDEEEVRVFADVALNREVFSQGQLIASVSLDDGSNPEEIKKRLDLLLAAAQFRARRAGILGNIQVEDGSVRGLLNFIDKLERLDKSIEEIKAVVSKDTYTVGPLKLRLYAISNGNILFNTEEIGNGEENQD
jgi:uncharacterized protein (DUF3084 family)